MTLLPEVPSGAASARARPVEAARVGTAAVATPAAVLWVEAGVDARGAAQLPRRPAGLGRLAHAASAELRRVARQVAATAVAGVVLAVDARPVAEQEPRRAAHLALARGAHLPIGAAGSALAAVRRVGPQVDALAGALGARNRWVAGTTEEAEGQNDAEVEGA